AQVTNQWIWLKNKKIGSNEPSYKNLVSNNPEILTPDDMVNYNIGYKDSINSGQDLDDILSTIRYTGTAPTTTNSRKFVSSAIPVKSATNSIIGNQDVKVLASGESIDIQILLKFIFDSLNPSNTNSIN